MSKRKLKHISLIACLSFFVFLAAPTVLADVTGTLSPTADGGNDSANWTNKGATACSGVDCYVEVDETSGGKCTSTSDGDTTYINSSTNSATQTFDLDLSSIGNNSTITQINISMCTKGTAAGAKLQTRKCIDDSCTNFGVDYNTSSDDYSATTQSHTGLSITKEAGTDIEIGVSNSSVNGVRVSKLSAQIIYTPAPVDATAPAAVSNLASTGASASSVDLSWTAPGDDNDSGTATTYDMRYSTSEITAGNWGSATVASGEPSPSIAGSSETMTVSGLTGDTTYYFALKTSDEVPNESDISNVPSKKTTDSIKPSAVSNLALSDASDSAITVSWTAPGDNTDSGTATTYDLRYSTSEITTGNWDSATQVSGEPSPSTAGSSESKVVSGLSAETLYYFALKTSDEVPNESDISNVPSLSTTAVPDTTDPAEVSNLSTANITQTTVDLTWTASGDDGSSGTASSYDIRYSGITITDENWDSATQVTGEPVPSVSGTSQSMTVSNLPTNTTYNFAMKVADEVPNSSGISNNAVATTLKSADEEDVIEGTTNPSKVIFSGKAYPGASIEVLQKSGSSGVYYPAAVEDSTISSDGTFYISLTALLSAEHFFALRVKDKDGTSAGDILFGVNLRSLVNNKFTASDIFIPPTIGLGGSVFKKDSKITVKGYARAGNTVEVKIGQNPPKYTKADTTGYYSYIIDTTGMSLGTYYVKVRQTEPDGTNSNYSFPKAFKLSKLSNPKADFNGDNEVTISDWSIFLYRWDSKDNTLKVKIDMNSDNLVDISDLSIFLMAMRF